jgi:hypothetical protein
MVPRSLFESGLTAFQDELSIKDEDRPKIKAWLDSWLVDASVKRPGKWAEQFRPKLMALADYIELDFDREKGRFMAKAGRPQDSDALVYLTRGTMWFDGIDRIEAELVRVISSTNPKSAP